MNATTVIHRSFAAMRARLACRVGSSVLPAALLMVLASPWAHAGTGANAELFNPRKADGLDAGEGAVWRGSSEGALAAVRSAGGIDALVASRRIAPLVDAYDVEPAYGDLVFAETDLVVALSGRDYTIVRSYISATAFDGAGLVGFNWAASPFMFLKEVGGDSPKDLRLAGPPMKAITYDHAGGVWSPGGPTAQTIVEASVVISSNTYATWRLTEPGEWTIDFYRPHDASGGYTATLPTHEGLIAREQDAYGATWDYEYTVYGTALSSDKHHARLTRVVCKTGDSAPATEAEIEFIWQDDDTQQEKGRLKTVKVKRSSEELQRVEYRYKANSDGLSSSLGTQNDLVEVRRYTKLDDSDTTVATWRLLVTQHRYHGGVASETSSDTDGDGYIEKGASHQLKSVFNPEQVEHFTQTIAGGSLDTLAEGADDLLTKADEAYWTGGSGPIVVDAAARVAAVYETSGEYRLSEQYLQTQCGCGGGSGATQGLKLAYERFSYGGSVTNTTKVTESQDTGGGWSARRTDYFDSGPASSGVLYLINEAIIDGSNKWVVHRAYDSTTRCLTHAMTPEARDTYTAGVFGAAPSYASKGSDGLVYAYAYSAEKRLTEIRMDKGDKGAVGNFTLVAEIAYGSGSGLTRKHLPASLKRYRVAGSSAVDDVELAEFTYGFHSGGADDAAWVEIKTEAELVAENGPAGSYYAYELFDGAGRNAWSCAEDLALTKRTFHAYSGEAEVVTRNASTSGLANPYPAGGGLSTSGWSRNGDGGKLETTFTRDKQGRIQKVVGPGGVNAYTYREMRAYSQRTGIEYYAETALPHNLTGGSTYDGPIRVTAISGAGRAIGSSDYAVSSITLGSGLVTGYSLGTELSRWAIGQDVAGSVTTRSVWHDISGNGKYDTVMTYDTLGRLATQEDPLGTIRRNTYDVLDRVIKVEVGTDDGSPGDMVAVTESFYDSGGSAAQGVGNGHITLLRRHVDGSTTRDTINTYDYRGNLIKVENAAAPHSYATFDNLDRPFEHAVFSSVPSGIGTTLADRGRYTANAFSQRGLIYRVRTAIDATQGGLTYLEAHTWRDETGRPICEWRPSVAPVKTTYDGLGRVKTRFITSRGGDANPGVSGNHADAAALTTDIIYEQTSSRYIADEELLDLVTTRRRCHDAAGTDYGDLSGLSSSKSIVTYQAHWYDDADRQTRSGEYGTNNSNGFEHGGSAPTVNQASPPSANGGDTTKLITETSYNNRGLVERVVSPRGFATKTLYDDMNRRIATIENHQDATVAWSGGSGRWASTNPGPGDDDRVTSFVYDGASHITKQVAHLPDGGGEKVQVTEYVYGVVKGAGAQDSDISTFDLIKEIRYPDESTGSPGSTDAYKVKHCYNRQGEIRKMTDQNKDAHVYTRDSMGRITQDVVTFDGSSPADQVIDAITTTYDGFGRRQYVRSRDGGAGGTIKNAVKFTYTPLWEVKDIWQDHDGDIDEGGGGSNSRKATHRYDASAAAGVQTNHSLHDRITYPDSANFDFVYEKNVKRVSKIERPTMLGATTIVEYSYLGRSMFSKTDYAVPDVELDYQVKHNGARTSGFYAGYDRFGRVVKQQWSDGSLTTHGSDNTVPNKPPIVEIGHGYDNSGSPTYRYDERPGALRADRDWGYTYDDLDRLIEAKKGIHGGWTYAPGSEKWTLDLLGNWTRFDTDSNGDGDYLDADEAQLRAHNAANEIGDQNTYQDPATLLIITGTDTNSYADTGAAGVHNPYSGGAATQSYTHDAWQRLVKVMYDANTRATYEYNGLNWRTVKVADPDGDTVLDLRRLMYYDKDWRILEEHIADGFDLSSTTDRILQNLWGYRAVDDLVSRRNDNNADGDYTDGSDRTWFALTDAQFSVVAVVRDTAELAERIQYTAYGRARHQWKADVTGDGGVDAGGGGGTDMTVATAAVGKSIHQAGYNVDADIDRDGDVDSTDTAMITNKTALAAGLITDAAGPDSVVGYDGFVFNAEDFLYNAGSRTLDTRSGRWLERETSTATNQAGNLYFLSASPASPRHPDVASDILLPQGPGPAHGLEPQLHPVWHAPNPNMGACVPIPHWHGPPCPQNPYMTPIITGFGDDLVAGCWSCWQLNANNLPSNYCYGATQRYSRSWRFGFFAAWAECIDPAAVASR